MSYDNGECKGLAGALFGHKFRPVFDNESIFTADPKVVEVVVKAMDNTYEAIDAEETLNNPFQDVLHEMNSDKDIYVQHVCLRCGKTVTRN